jgi:hypothetical protein
MIKYQICIHVKNNDLPDFIKGEEFKSDIFYHINFKGFFDSIDQGLDFIRDKYQKVIRNHMITYQEIIRSTHITKIDTIKCPKWEKIFLQKV